MVINIVLETFIVLQELIYIMVQFWVQNIRKEARPVLLLAESLGIYKRYWGGSFKGMNNYFFMNLKNTPETPGVKPYRSYYRGNYFPDDQTFTWDTDFVMPDQQSTDPNQGYDPETNKQLTLTSKPFILVYGVKVLVDLMLKHIETKATCLPIWAML
jgi:hypothetical protein